MTIAATERSMGTLAPVPDDGKTYKIPTLRDVYQARKVLQTFLPRTPMLRSAVLAERLGFDLFLKYENLQPIGAFKIRGGIYLLSQMSPEDRALGLYTASTGNHGQSIAYAAREFGAKATIFAPEGANPVKVAAMKRLGAEVVFYGPDFDTARKEAENRAQRDGAHFIHSANVPELIAGVATCSLEMLEDVPDLEQTHPEVAVRRVVGDGLEQPRQERRPQDGLFAHERICQHQRVVVEPGTFEILRRVE